MSLAGGLRRRARAGATRSQIEADPALTSVLSRDQRDMGNMRRLIAFSLRPDACCVDVGAHRGAILEEIVRVAPGGRQIAYEPIPKLAAGLRRSFPGVEVREAALSDHAGHTTFEHVLGPAEGCSGFVVCTVAPEYAPDVEQIEVQLERLDDVIAPDTALDMIKIDVEGAEQQVLEGALETLRRTRPIVLLEHAFAASNAYGTAPDDVYGLLCERIGLRIFDLDGNGPFTAPEFDERSRRGDPVNFVAHR
jgi:FkbM family methyltransferase